MAVTLQTGNAKGTKIFQAEKKVVAVDFFSAKLVFLPRARFFPFVTFPLPPILTAYPHPHPPSSSCPTFLLLTMTNTLLPLCRASSSRIQTF
jgi:hypothetical protein